MRKGNDAFENCHALQMLIKQSFDSKKWFAAGCFNQLIWLVVQSIVTLMEVVELSLLN